jgi:membrane protein DedA with SNARE-associated domain
MAIFKSDFAAYKAVAFFAIIEGESMLVTISSTAAIKGSSLNILYIIIIAVVFTFLADTILFLIGRFGKKYIYSLSKKLKCYDYIKYMENYIFERKARYLIFFRFILGIRLIIPIFLGMDSSVSFLLFSFYNIVTSFIWGLFFSYTGYFLAKMFLLFFSLDLLEKFTLWTFRLVLFISLIRLMNLYFFIRGEIKKNSN